MMQLKNQWSGNKRECRQLIQNSQIKGKTVMSSGTRKKKGVHFLQRLFCLEEIFNYLFLSQCLV